MTRWTLNIQCLYLSTLLWSLEAGYINNNMTKNLDSGVQKLVGQFGDLLSTFSIACIDKPLQRDLSRQATSSNTITTYSARDRGYR